MLPAAAHAARQHRPSGHGRRIEQGQRVMQLPLLGPGAAASARHVEHGAEQLPAELLDGGVAGGDAAGIDIHQIMPAPRQFASGRDLDHRHRREAVRRAAPGREHMQRHAGRELQRAADEIAGRRRRIEQALVARPLAGRDDARNRRAARFDDRAHRLLDDIRQTALLVARRRIGAAVDAAAFEIAVVPAELGDQRFRHIGIGRTCRELRHAVADLGILREHHGRPGADQKIAGESERRVRRHAGKRVAAAALHADHKRRGRTGLALAARRGAAGAARPCA